jgi:molybdopterin-guanine dinucleotide biosynthesis protein A
MFGVQVFPRTSFLVPRTFRATFVKTGTDMGIEPKHQTKQTGVTGVILAGGRSSRMGSNKALLPYRGGLFIEAIHRRLAALFPEVLLITNTPEQYDFLPCRKAGDLFPEMGALAGLHAGLHHSSNDHIFAVACDMPYLDDRLIRYLVGQRHNGDLIIPKGEGGLEPLHAVYSKRCLLQMEASLMSGRRRIVSFFDRVAVVSVPESVTAAFDPCFRSFSNINTPDDYYALRVAEQEECDRVAFRRQNSC